MATELVHTLLIYYCYYALALGITSYRYDTVAQTTSSTRWSRLYVWVVNILTIVTSPWIMWMSDADVTDIAEVSVLAVYANRLMIVVNYIVIVYTIALRQRRERAVEKVARQVQQLKVFESVDDSDDSFLRRLFYIKYANVIYLTISRVLGYLCGPRDLTWTHLLAAVVLANVMNILYLTTFSYFLAMWQMCRGFCNINKRLQVLKSCYDRTATPGRPTKELQKLCMQHMKLTQMSLQLNDIFGWQMLAAQFEYIVVNVTYGFFGIVFLIGFDTPLYILAFGFFSYLMHAYAFLLVDMICDATVQQQWHTLQILREYAECSDLPKSMELQLSAFAMHLSGTKLRLNICNLFEINKTRWLKVLSTVVSYTILLLQFYLTARYQPTSEQ